MSALKSGVEIRSDLVPVHPGPFHRAAGGSCLCLEVHVSVDEETFLLIVESGAWGAGVSEVATGWLLARHTNMRLRQDVGKPENLCSPPIQSSNPLGTGEIHRPIHRLVVFVHGVCLAAGVFECDGQLGVITVALFGGVLVNVGVETAHEL